MEYSQTDVLFWFLHTNSGKYFQLSYRNHDVQCEKFNVGEGGWTLNWCYIFLRNTIKPTQYEFVLLAIDKPCGQGFKSISSSLEFMLFGLHCVQLITCASNVVFLINSFHGKLRYNFYPASEEIYLFFHLITTFSDAVSGFSHISFLPSFCSFDIFDITYIKYIETHPHLLYMVNDNDCFRSHTE